MYSRAPKQQTAHNSPSSHQQSNSHLPFIHAFEHNNMLEWIRMYILYYVHMWTVESSAQVPFFFFFHCCWWCVVGCDKTKHRDSLLPTYTYSELSIWRTHSSWAWGEPSLKLIVIYSHFFGWIWIGYFFICFFFFFRFYWLRSLVTHSRSSNSSLPWIWYGGVNVDNLYCVWTHGRVGQWLVAVRRTELQNKFNEKRNMRDYTLKWSLR